MARPPPYGLGAEVVAPLVPVHHSLLLKLETLIPQNEEKTTATTARAAGDDARRPLSGPGSKGQP